MSQRDLTRQVQLHCHTCEFSDGHHPLASTDDKKGILEKARNLEGVCLTEHDAISRDPNKRIFTYDSQGRLLRLPGWVFNSETRKYERVDMSAIQRERPLLFPGVELYVTLVEPNDPILMHLQRQGIIKLSGELKRDVNIEILGLGVDPNSPTLQALCNLSRTRRMERNLEYARNINRRFRREIKQAQRKYGGKIDMVQEVMRLQGPLEDEGVRPQVYRYGLNPDEQRDYPCKYQVGRSDIARVMIEKHLLDGYAESGQKPDVNLAFKVALTRTGKRSCYVPRQAVSLKEGLVEILKAGGIPVLAHGLVYAEDTPELWHPASLPVSHNLLRIFFARTTELREDNPWTKKQYGFDLTICGVTMDYPYGTQYYVGHPEIVTAGLADTLSVIRHLGIVPVRTGDYHKDAKDSNTNEVITIDHPQFLEDQTTINALVAKAMNPSADVQDFLYDWGRTGIISPNQGSQGAARPNGFPYPKK